MLRSCALFAASALFAACTTSSGDTTILMLRNQAPAAGCVITADPNAAFIPSGRLDVELLKPNGVPQGYLLTPVVQNVAVADLANQAQVAQRTALIQGAHVDITFLSSDVVTDADQQMLDSMGLLHFDARFAGAVPPNASVSTYSFELIPAGVIDMVTGRLQTFSGGTGRKPDVTMIAKVVVFGQLGGGTVEAPAFDYPVTACDGCMTNDVGPCAALSSSFMAHTGGACSFYQDGVLDCCEDGAQFVCPAVRPTSGA
jgi:hypothetical protein